MFLHDERRATIWRMHVMKPTRMYGTIGGSDEEHDCVNRLDTPLGRHVVLCKYHEPQSLDPEQGREHCMLRKEVSNTK
jgi:hypothetical protein